MTTYDAAPHLRDLTEFQRRSVDHVFDQFYGPAQAQRFLVADETGLGKTRVAQGVIAKAIEHLQHDDSVKRIDVIYVCANADLAQQNIKRLNVTGQPELPFSSRLTMLGAHSARLNTRAKGGHKPINLVSFTPGTSFDMGHSLGMARERAMILLGLSEIYDFDGWTWKAALRILQGTVTTVERFEDRVDELHRELDQDGFDPRIRKAFSAGLSRRRDGKPSLHTRLCELLDAVGRKRYVPDEYHEQTLTLVRGLRRELARASVETLEPDLVILDEFQRFKHLLSEDNPAGELAHYLFEHEAAKVLLLSATPYKPFTYAEEREEDHAKDLFTTLGFLAKGRDDVDVADIKALLASYRAAVVAGIAPDEVVRDLRLGLMKLMSRAERPVLPEGSMLVEHKNTADDVSALDLVGYARLRDVSRYVEQDRDRGLVTPEYWKSAPYFINFCDGYKLGERIDSASEDPDLLSALRATQRIDARHIASFRALDPGNARIRALAEDTLDRGWWKLLWVPPSMPYVEPSGPFAETGTQRMTKRLVFSSWTATPSSVASILSYEAERRSAEGTNYTQYTPANRKRLARHLQYSLRAGTPAKMSTLLLHWPMPTLAAAADPLRVLATRSGQPVPTDALRELVRAAIEGTWSADARSTDDATDTGDTDLRESHWRAAFATPSNWPVSDDAPASVAAVTSALEGGSISDDDDEPIDATGLGRHVELAADALASGLSSFDGDTADVLTDVALFSPGNIAYRVVMRIAAGTDATTPMGLFRASAHLANGLRSLFNRPDTIKLIEKLALAGDAPFWRQVLAYCAAGNLEAALDEYLHHLAADVQGKVIDDQVLFGLAAEASAAIGLRGSTYRAKDPVNLEHDLAFSPRFALRYGGRQHESEDVRQPEVRRSFNSPFWPMVLASTSVGQEGIDFHWWCHAIFHWNTPANPVDFEQREGRVDRYRGHAVRKNIATRHGSAVLSTWAPGNPWDRLFDAATEYQSEFGDFTPGWVYPGPHKIERHVAPFLLSSDEARYDKIKQDVALYRLTFGQPRQEDMLELLRKQGLHADPDSLRAMRIDLAP